MDIIPLTLALSLLLSLTFIALFVREFSRPRRAGAEHDSLLPLADEHSAAPGRAAGHAHHHVHAADEICASKRGDGKCCASCQRRKDRTAAKAAGAAES